MTLSEAIRSGFANWRNFEGRSLRSEFWWWTLFLFLVGLVANLADMAIFGSPQVVERANGAVDVIGGGMWISALTTILLFVPSLALSVRRLHDVGKSGWWYLINVIPFVGWIIFFIWMATPGNAGVNRYGAEP